MPVLHTLEHVVARVLSAAQQCCYLHCNAILVEKTQSQSGLWMTVASVSSTNRLTSNEGACDSHSDNKERANPRSRKRPNLSHFKNKPKMEVEAENQYPSIRIPLSDSDECIELFVDELSDDPSKLIEILLGECVHPMYWIQVAVGVVKDALMRSLATTA